MGIKPIGRNWLADTSGWGRGFVPVGCPCVCFDWECVHRFWKGRGADWEPNKTSDLIMAWDVHNEHPPLYALMRIPDTRKDVLMLVTPNHGKLVAWSTYIYSTWVTVFPGISSGYILSIRPTSMDDNC